MLIRLAAITAALLLSPMLADLSAQRLAYVDSSRTAEVDSTRHDVPGSVNAARAGVSGRRSSRHERLPMIFYGALATGAAAAAILHVDPDSGGYRDGWTTATDFPDKAVHALAAWAITSVGVDLGARPRYAAVAVCAAGTAFEFAQGYVSAYDVAADCAGAAGAGLWQSWRARRRAREATKH
jgi:hypothetical protein